MALLNIEVFLHIGNALIVNIDPVLSLPFTGNHCVYKLLEETFSSKSVSLVMKWIKISEKNLRGKFFGQKLKAYLEV